MKRLMGISCAAVMASVLGAQPMMAASAGLPQHGGVSHTAGAQGYLGIDVRDIAEERVGLLRVKDTHGAEIIRVDHDGPAGKMGLRERDVILQMNGVAVEGQEQMRRMLRDSSPGQQLSLLISRDGQQMTVGAQMADRNQVEKLVWEQHLMVAAPLAPGPQAPAQALPTGEGFVGAASSGGAAPSTKYSRSFLGTLLMSPSYTGAMLEMMGPQLAGFFGVPGGAGLLVRSVESNSPASTAGMKAGDIIVRANAAPVGTMSEWAKTIAKSKGRSVVVVVLRDREEKTLTLTPDGKRRSSVDGTPLKGSSDEMVARATEL